MQHDQLFAASLCATPAHCLGLPLRRYSLFHEAQLLADQSPFRLNSFAEILALPESERLAHLIKAVDICSQSRDEFIASTEILASNPRWFELRARRKKSRLEKVWARWEKFIHQQTTLAIGAAFGVLSAHIATGCTGPRFETPTDGDGVAVGAPELANLIAHVRRQPAYVRAQYGAHELDYPLALARFEYYSALECENKVHLKADNSFEDWVSEQEAKVAAGEIKLPPCEPIKPATAND